MIDDRRSRTFVLGAGFSEHEGFPLMSGLRSQVIGLLESHGTPGPPATVGTGYEQYDSEEFISGLRDADPDGNLGFEELWIKLGKQARSPLDYPHAGVTLQAVRNGCVRLFWERQDNLGEGCKCCDHFAAWLRRNPGAPTQNAIISFNWDLVPEWRLPQKPHAWRYTASEGHP